MTVAVPSWLVGLVGALVVLVSTFFLTIRVMRLDEEILRAKDTSSVLSSRIDTKWENHQLADLREAQADQHAGLSLLATSNEIEVVLVNAAAGSLSGAILAMDLAAYNRLSEDEIAVLGYNARKALLNDLRLESRDAINELAAEKQPVDNEVVEKEDRRSRLRMLAMALNLLGLAIVLLKDLPVWKGNRPARGNRLEGR